MESYMNMNTMILNALLLTVGVGIVSADFTCPGGRVTCSEGKACCIIQTGSGYSCCDKPDNDDDLIPGVPRMRQTFLNQSLTPSGPQHSLSLTDLDFCPNTSGKRLCCDFKDPYNPTLADCVDNSECCDNENCCMRGYSCCIDWCCKKGYKCGDYFMKCKNGAVMAQGAQGMAVMVAVALATLKIARI